MKREMPREEAADRLTQLYEKIHYAKMMKCTTAAISEEYYDKMQDAIEMAIDALKSEHKMTNREYLIKLLESGDEKIVQYLNCAACIYKDCAEIDSCETGMQKFLNAEREEEQ